MDEIKKDLIYPPSDSYGTVIDMKDVQVDSNAFIRLQKKILNGIVCIDVRLWGKNAKNVEYPKKKGISIAFDVCKRDILPALTELLATL